MDATRQLGRRGGLLYPMLLIAAVALTAFSIVGIATLTGTLPKALSTPAPAADAPPQGGASAGVSPGTAESKADPADAGSEARRLAPSRTMRQSARGSPSRPEGSEPRSPAACANCGIVESVRAVRVAGQTSLLGAVAGGVVGGVLGNQVGRGGGRTAMTVVGAGAGAYAGHELEKNMNQATRYQIRVRMNDGTVRTLHESVLPSWEIGQRVRVTGRSIVAAE